MFDWARLLVAALLFACPLQVHADTESLKTILFKQCFEASRAGQPVSVVGLVKLRGADAEYWKDGLSGEAYIKQDGSPTPIVMLVPTDRSEPECIVIYHGFGTQEFNRFFDDVRRMGLVEIKDYTSNQDGVQTRAAANMTGGNMRLLLAAHVAALRNTTFIVHSENSLGAK